MPQTSPMNTLPFSGAWSSRRPAANALGRLQDAPLSQKKLDEPSGSNSSSYGWISIVLAVRLGQARELF